MQHKYTFLCKHCGKAFESRDKRTFGFCGRSCYQAYTRQHSTERFWSHIDQSGGERACWLWLRHRQNKGYGFVKWHGRPRLAHRIAYTLTYGPIPDGIEVMHICDTPACCNPSHLRLGTHADNMADMANKGRSRHR